MTTMTPPKPSYKRGDVILVLFPHSDLRTAKPRPALIVQADDLQTGLAQVIVAMITSHLSRANHPSRVTIPLATLEGRQSGLLADSVVMTDNLATVTASAIGATRRQVRRMVIAEALLLAAIGTALGLLAGLYLSYVMVLGMSTLFPMAYSYPLGGVTAAVAVGLIFGVIAALIPARQAAGMEIVRALQYE